jgi:outer membrane PBP1 activator LpoA protein
MRRLTPILVAALLVAGCGTDQPKSAAPRPQAAAKALAGSPPELAALHRQANQLLGGGAGAFKAL